MQQKMDKQKRKTGTTKGWFLETKGKFFISTARLIKICSIRNERGYITIDPKYIKKQ